MPKMKAGKSFKPRKGKAGTKGEGKIVPAGEEALHSTEELEDKVVEEVLEQCDFFDPEADDVTIEQYEADASKNDNNAPN
jgi:hypothetical protein